MIVKKVYGDVFTTEDSCIVFALNTEGYNDSGFAGQVAKRFFPEIANTGGNRLGDVLSKTVGDKTFYGIVCHSLHDGWNGADKIILRALNEMKHQEASVIAIGTGFVGMVSGAPAKEIYRSFEECNKKLTLYQF